MPRHRRQSHYVDHISVNGISDIYYASTWTTRTLWVIVFVVATTAAAYNVSKNFQEWYAAPYVISTDFVVRTAFPESELGFNRALLEGASIKGGEYFWSSNLPL